MNGPVQEGDLKGRGPELDILDPTFPSSIQFYLPGHWWGAPSAPFLVSQAMLGFCHFEQSPTYCISQQL